MLLRVFPLLADTQDAVRVLLPERLRVLQARAVQHVHLEAPGGHRRRLERGATERNNDIWHERLCLFDAFGEEENVSSTWMHGNECGPKALDPLSLWVKVRKCAPSFQKTFPVSNSTFDRLALCSARGF